MRWRGNEGWGKQLYIIEGVSWGIFLSKIDLLGNRHFDIVNFYTTSHYLKKRGGKGVKRGETKRTSGHFNTKPF